MKIKTNINNFNWESINLDYKNGMSKKELKTKYKISQNNWKLAKESNFLIIPSPIEIRKKRSELGLWKSTHHTDETKKIMSIKRKNFLSKNKLHRWSNSKHHKSVPCEKFKEYLKERNISFVGEHEPLRQKGRYFSIDIAFPDKLIGIEINGRQHYDSNTKLLPYYQNRHDLIEQEGWKLYEIPYNQAFNKEKMNEIIDIILSSTTKIEFDYENYLKLRIPKIVNPKRKYVKIDKKEITMKNGIKMIKSYCFTYDWPSIDKLESLCKVYTTPQISDILNIGYKTVHCRLSSLNLKSQPVKW
jgi:very-short-patch-repair endonuclease